MGKGVGSWLERHCSAVLLGQVGSKVVEVVEVVVVVTGVACVDRVGLLIAVALVFTLEHDARTSARKAKIDLLGKFILKCLGPVIFFTSESEL